MDPDGLQQWFILGLCLFFSAFFSASETALISLNKIRLRAMADENVKGSKMLLKLTSQPEKLLGSILVGNNFVNIALTSLATALAISISGDNARVLGLTTALVTVSILIFGEITPKTFASKNAERVARFVVKPIYFFMILLMPFVTVLNLITSFIMRLVGVEVGKNNNAITEAELKTMVNVSHEEGLIRIDEREMINNVFEFDEYNAKDIMTPRTDMVAISVAATFEEVIKIFKHEQFSRIPAYLDDMDHIVGILHFKDFAFEGENSQTFVMEKYLRTPFFTYESKPISELFAEMRKTGVNIAIVLDEYGGTLGLVTMEDLIEEIVGEIADEFDEAESAIEHISPTEFVVKGGAKIEDVSDVLPVCLESDDYDSIGGYVMGLLGNVPAQNDVATYKNVQFIVEKVSKNRITQLRIRVI